MAVGTLGVWAAQLRSRERSKVRDVAGAIEEFGYDAAWIPGGAGGDLMGDVDAALGATTRLVVCTGVLNIWMHESAEVAAWQAANDDRHPRRLLLGLGASHPELVDRSQDVKRYKRPLSALADYLDALEEHQWPYRRDRVLAALGPRMLRLAANRTLGAHTYLVDPRHTARARDVMGPDAFLAVELKAVLDPRSDTARDVARAHLGMYLGLQNYVRNLRDLGYTEADVAAGGSDRLVDGVVAWGDAERIVDRAQQHFDAGATHVCIQLLTADRRDVPLDGWRVLGVALREQTFVGRSGAPSTAEPTSEQ